MSETSYIPRKSSSGESGYEIHVNIPDTFGKGDATVVVFANEKTGNKMYVETYDGIDNDNLEKKECVREALEGECLKFLTLNRFDEALSVWADDVLAAAKDLWEQLKANNFKLTELNLNGEFFCVVAPCYDIDFTCEDDMNSNAKNISMKDIDYYLTQSNEISGGKSLYMLANAGVNKELVHEHYLSEERKLQNFYNENIYPIRNIALSELAPKQQEMRNFYSDWHKEMYGYRPHSQSQDECFKRRTEQAKTLTERNCG